MGLFSVKSSFFVYITSPKDNGFVKDTGEFGLQYISILTNVLKFYMYRLYST